MIFARYPVEVAAAMAAAAVLAVGCGKAETPKVDGGVAPSGSGSKTTEQAEANKRARQDVFGAQVKAVDDAKGMQDDLNKKAQEGLDKVDAMSK